jgi:DNA polymerase-3 subunit epsilon
MPGNRIKNLGIIRIENGIIVEKFESFVNPGMSIPPSITLVNGITDEDVAEAPTFEEISDTISRLFEGGIFVAHNASFDYGFLKREFGRIGVAFSAPVLCTVKLSRALFPKARSHSLDALIRRHKFSCTGCEQSKDNLKKLPLHKPNFSQSSSNRSFARPCCRCQP